MIERNVAIVSGGCVVSSEKFVLNKMLACFGFCVKLSVLCAHLRGFEISQKKFFHFLQLALSGLSI